ncbi:MAG TPA: hypothetical protein VNJ70_15970 [Thermoanaerobaculia bacterium]|nr:hypothetical protein [Thermoanaerobaculia bacterium]
MTLENIDRKPGPSELEQDLAHGASFYREAIDEILRFMQERNLTAALAVASHLLVNSVSLLRYTSAGMVFTDQRKRGGEATRKTALDAKLADELLASARANPGRSWEALEQELASRMETEPQLLGRLGLRKPMTAEAIRRRRQRSMARARNEMG